MEPILTDALSSVILNRAVLPRFKAGDIPGGIVAGTDALVEQLSLDPSVAEQHAAVAASDAEQAQAAPSRSRGLPLGAIFNALIILFVLSAVFRRRGRRGGLGWWPLIFLGGGGRGWSGGDGGSWGGGGGGGFSGGGGSFGGGGSSGSW